MNSIARGLAATAIVLPMQFYAQHSLAQDFTGKDFASWSEASQNSFIQTSVTMAGVVLSRVQPEKAECVNKWYGGNQKSERNAFIRKTIASFGTFHPSGTVLAIIEQECGSLK